MRSGWNAWACSFWQSSRVMASTVAYSGLRAYGLSLPYTASRRGADEDGDHLVVAAGDALPQADLGQLDLVLGERRARAGSRRTGRSPRRVFSRRQRNPAYAWSGWMPLLIEAPMAASRSSSQSPLWAALPPLRMTSPVTSARPAFSAGTHSGARAEVGAAAHDRQGVVLEQEDDDAVGHHVALGLGRLDAAQRRGGELRRVEQRGVLRPGGRDRDQRQDQRQGGAAQMACERHGQRPPSLAACGGGFTIMATVRLLLDQRALASPPSGRPR